MRSTVPSASPRYCTATRWSAICAKTAMPAERSRSGWLVLDKLAGITSSQVVVRLRRATGVKAGHAGTLDPLATGLLPIALGEATKTVGFVSKDAKRYRFRVRWGIS